MSDQLAFTLPARSYHHKMFPRNPARKGTQAWIVFETLVNAGGILTNHELARRCEKADVLNYRARVSDLRDLGVDIKVDKKSGIYELVKV